jgi:hypothetical protein
MDVVSACRSIGVNASPSCSSSSFVLEMFSVVRPKEGEELAANSPDFPNECK